MGVLLENNQNVVVLSDSFLENIVNIVDKVLKFENVDIDYEVFISIVDNHTIRKINYDHRGIDAETDCLSFPILNYDTGKVFKEQYKDLKFENHDLEDGKLILGDVIISIEKAKFQSVEFNHSLEREVGYLVIHSILHLLGYDHLEYEDKRFMRDTEKSIIRKLGIYR